MKSGVFDKFRPFVLGAIGGAAAIALWPLTGLPGISADPARWGISDWFSYVSARQSVTLRSLGTEAPDDLDDPARLRRAAGHYELVCADCHGSPARPAQQFALNLSPLPPALAEQMQEWRPEARVFETVKHGIRGSAMPAWPTQMRDDEVWDMVAFLKVLPEVNPEEYAAFAAQSDCAMCHGERGEGGGAGLPRLDTLSPDYIAAALKSFRDGTRQSGPMMAAARQLSDGEIAELAMTYGRDVPAEANGQGEAAVIAQQGIAARDIPACVSCHGSTARKDYPRLAGQDSDYLLTQLELFMEHGAERGGARAQMMAEAVKALTEDEAKALANYYGQ